MRPLVVVLFGLLCACTSKIRDGEVEAKGHKEAATIVMLMPITTCRAVGKVTSCSTMHIPIFMHYPERWYVKIKKYDGEEWLHATWWVPEPAYEQVQVGGYFVVTKDCLDDEPRQRGERA